MSNNPTLKRIAASIDSGPTGALEALDSIDYNALSRRDRYFYDFLALKARDKAYITHTSDSTILALIDYYNNDKTLGSEVLYYGARVYSDLGDYPAALQYFHAALDRIPYTPEHYKLRGAVLSQTAHLLNKLRLYKESVPYTEEALEIDKLYYDTINIVYDYQLLGGIYLRANELNQADSCFREAMKYSRNLPKAYNAKTKMYLAATMHKKGQIDSALHLIRGTYDDVKPLVRNSVLAYSSKIYYEAGILDSAYMYSHRLIHSDDPKNRIIGYDIILSPKLRSYISHDSLTQYILDYRGILENFYNDNQNQLALNEQNFFNYSLHQREKEKAQKRAETFKKYIFGFLFIIVLLYAIILFLKNMNKRRIIELKEAIEKIDRLKQELNIYSLQKLPYETESSDIPNEIVENLRERLQQEIKSLTEQSTKPPTVSDIITQSETFKDLIQYINNEKILKETDPLWDELEKTVLMASPTFKINLQVLTSGKLTISEYHTSLLIKCGIRTMQIAKLLCKSHGTIVSRREILCFKIFGEKHGAKFVDSAIHYL